MALPKLEVPTYELVQPSTGKKIRFRPFLVKEHKLLLTMVEADDQEIVRMVKEIIDVCTFKKLKINSLPHFDIEYIFMKLRAKSIGEKVDVVVTCAKCGDKYDSQFDIENLTVESKGDFTNKIMLTDTVGIQMGYPSFDHVVKVFQDGNVDNIFEIVRECIVGIFDGENFYEAKDQSKEEIDDFLSSLTKEQFDKIEDFFVNAPKVVQTMESDCTTCGFHNVSRIEGIQNFFV